MVKWIRMLIGTVAMISYTILKINGSFWLAIIPFLIVIFLLGFE